MQKQQIFGLGTKRLRSETEQEAEYQFSETKYPPLEKSHEEEVFVNEEIHELPLENEESMEANTIDFREGSETLNYDNDLRLSDLPADPNPMNARDGYFGSYSRLNIHDIMLCDTIRTESYKNSLSFEVVKDKVVLDVGCGTGILSMFAARSGARKVYAVDEAEILHFAKANIKENED